MTVTKRAMTGILTAAIAGALCLTGAAAANAATPQETMTASLTSLAADINALLESGISGEEGDAAAEEVFTRNGFSTNEIRTIDEAIAAGGGMEASGNIIEVIRMFDDGQTSCVGQLIGSLRTWAPGEVMCVSRDVALIGAGVAKTIVDVDAMTRLVRAESATDPAAAGRITPAHVWQAAKEYGYAKGKAPKTWNAGRGIGRGDAGGIKATGKNRYLLAARIELATGDTAVCTTNLTVKGFKVTSTLPSCVLVAA